MTLITLTVWKVFSFNTSEIQERHGQQKSHKVSFCFIWNRWAGRNWIVDKLKQFSIKRSEAHRFRLFIHKKINLRWQLFKYFWEENLRYTDDDRNAHNTNNEPSKNISISMLCDVHKINISFVESAYDNWWEMNFFAVYFAIVIALVGSNGAEICVYGVNRKCELTLADRAVFQSTNSKDNCE